MGKYLKIANIALIASIILLLVGCGNSDTFIISGEITGLGTRNLRFYYYDGSTLQVGMASCIDSKFRFEGNSKRPTLLTIATAQRNVLGHIVVENGDDIELKINAADLTQMEVKGNDVSTDYASFLRGSSDLIKNKDYAGLNRAVEKVVANNRNKMFVTVAYLIHYNPRLNVAEADSVLQSIDPSARPPYFITGYRSMIEEYARENTTKKIGPLSLVSTGDSLTTFNPATTKRTLFVFTDSPNPMTDSINEAVGKIAHEKNDSLKAVVNVWLDSDTIQWHKSLKTASGHGLNVWAPGSVASERLQSFVISRLPSFVVTDSTSAIVYSGESLTKALEKFGD